MTRGRLAGSPVSIKAAFAIAIENGEGPHLVSRSPAWSWSPGLECKRLAPWFDFILFKRSPL